jgi:hypothetical protein
MNLVFILKLFNREFFGSKFSNIENLFDRKFSDQSESRRFYKFMLSFVNLGFGIFSNF